VTIREIAHLAHVSIGTVDRVIHNRGRVAPETAEKVRRIIEETGYRPNIHARHLSLAKSYRFAVFTPEKFQDCGFWELPQGGIDRITEELSVFNISIDWYSFDRNSEHSFLETARKLLEADPDGVLLAPVLLEPSRQFCRSLQGTVPFVFFDSYLPGTGALAYIGQNSYASGLVAAHLMKLLVDNPSRVAVLQARKNDLHICKRIEGFLSCFEQTEMPAVFTEEHLDDQEICNGFLSRLLQEQESWEGVYVANAAVGRVANFLGKRHPEIRLIGYDIIGESTTHLKSGTIDFLISQKPQLQVYYGLMLLYRYVVLKQRAIEDMVMPIDILTRENIDFYT
jgi:LacI family transcriptional regulator